MKTASEIQIEALAKGYDEVCGYLEAVHLSLEKMVCLFEAGKERDVIATCAQELRDDIGEMLEGKIS